MSTQVYEQVFLVNNIPEIAGIFEVKDMIKRYVLTHNWHMEKAYEFAEKFKFVNETIRRAISRNNSNRQHSASIADQFWEFGFYLENEGEKIFIYSSNCCICGEYTSFKYDSNIPTCVCSHNLYG
uniref:Uncharacterized protein n=1 Tax=viral metagenome TaxID=1070528 RepID=A0A6C0HUR2_9ZZZZ